MNGLSRRVVLVKALFSAAAFCVIGAALTAQDAGLRVSGAGPQPVVLTRADIAALPHQTVTTTLRDQSIRYEGVAVIELLKRAGMVTTSLRGDALAKSVVVTGADGYRAVFALAELSSDFSDKVILLADRRDGAALPDNALPYQVIVAGDKLPTRWVRQTASIDVIDAPKTRP